MERKQILPKVLVVGINAWKEGATTHTLMEIFRCWDPERLALVYTRADLPNTKVCENYFQISESQVLKSVFKPWKTVGRVVQNTGVVDIEESKQEQERYAKAHKKNSSLLPLLREFVWKFGRWKSKELKEFVRQFDPDIIFIPIYPTAYMGRIQRYITKLTGKPTVCYLADDNYSYDSCDTLWRYVQRFWLRRHVAPIAKNCSEMFVIVEKEKEDTDQRFGTDSVILTKGIDFTNRTFEPVSITSPIKFVYTGSMVIGRDKTLALLADSINKVNSDGNVKAELYIYSQTQPSDEILSRINVGASHYCGRVGRDEVIDIQKNAHVVVFAEALSGKEANAAKLSFSTKITDYLSNGKCILAIGKDYIAPIDYFTRNDSALVASDVDSIAIRVQEIIEKPSLINEYGSKAFECARRNHDKHVIAERFVSVMKKAAR